MHHPSKVFEVFVGEEDIGSLETEAGEGLEAEGANMFVGVAAKVIVGTLREITIRHCMGESYH